MHEYLFQQIIVQINKQKEKNILFLGISYKSNCSDIRNSQLINLIQNLKKKVLKITLVDPNINKEEVYKETGIMALKKIPRNKKYSIILFGLYHDQFKELSKNNFKDYCLKNTIICTVVMII